MSKENVEGREENLGLIDYLNILLKRWRLVIIGFVGIVFFTGLFSLIKRPIFTAEVTILPSFETQPGFTGSILQLGEIANQLGLSPGEVSINSPLVYEKMLKSREVIDKIVLRRFKLPSEQTEKTLIDIYKINKNNPFQKQLYLAYKKLLGSLRVKIDNQSMTLTLSIRAGNPYLAAAITNAMVEELDQYNREIRTVKAAKNKSFIGGRVSETRDKLREAEEELTKFRQENRRIEDSPELSLELGRLIREVKLQEELFITLNREYELAKIQEVKDIPLIYTLGEARPPIEKSSPKITLNLIMAAIISLVLGVVAVHICEYAERSGWNRQRLKEKEGFRVISNDLLSIKQIIKRAYKALFHKKT